MVLDPLEDERFHDNPLVTGEPGIRFYAGCPLAAPDGSQVGTLCLIDREPRAPDSEDIALLRDLAGMVEDELAALELATVDALTGITNRRGFDAVGAHALSASRRLRRPATLLFLDLDGLKGINDGLGHEAGDRALCEFAGLLVDVLPGLGRRRPARGGRVLRSC